MTKRVAGLRAQVFLAEELYSHPKPVAIFLGPLEVEVVVVATSLLLASNPPRFYRPCLSWATAGQFARARA